MPPSDEADMLRREAEAMKQALDDINQRLQNLESRNAE
jgi:hypothetical protein